MQVRVSMDIFEENTMYLKNFIKLYYAYEDIIYKFGFNGSNPRESIVAFAKPCDYLLQTIINAKLDMISFYSSISLINNLLRNKQYGLSFYAKDNQNMPSSFEFRMFNGTLDYNTILNLVNMSVCLTLNSKEELDMEKINYRIEEAKNKSIGYFSSIKEDKALEFSKTIFKEESSIDSFMLQYKK